MVSWQKVIEQLNRDKAALNKDIEQARQEEHDKDRRLEVLNAQLAELNSTKSKIQDGLDQSRQQLSRTASDADGKTKALEEKSRLIDGLNRDIDNYKKQAEDKQTKLNGTRIKTAS